MKYRHELKYEISYANLLILRQRLNAVMQKDTHAIDGKYEIRSLYFDNANDKALREKLDGVNKREKFRIRFYNSDSSLIHLEKKSKMNGLCMKENVRLSEEQARRIADGEYDWLIDCESPLLKELYLKMKHIGLRPKTIVDYTREAFVFAPGNVRVTLDYNIRTGLLSKDFLNPSCVTVPVADNPIVLEIKWDEYLPNIIKDVLQLGGVRVGAFSKYAVSRMYD